MNYLPSSFNIWKEAPNDIHQRNSVVFLLKYFVSTFNDWWSQTIYHDSFIQSESKYFLRYWGLNIFIRRLEWESAGGWWGLTKKCNTHVSKLILQPDQVCASKIIKLSSTHITELNGHIILEYFTKSPRWDFIQPLHSML